VPLDIQWTLTVQVPQLGQLATIGAQLVEQLAEIKQTLMRIEESQAGAAEALAEQVTVIAQEVSQWNTGAITTEQLTKLQTTLSTIAQTAESQAAQIRANSAEIAAIVPDTPA
jgi:septal ring factor EnvC (AmiA/AmiB activator)